MYGDDLPLTPPTAAAVAHNGGPSGSFTPDDGHHCVQPPLLEPAHHGEPSRSFTPDGGIRGGPVPAAAAAPANVFAQLIPAFEAFDLEDDDDQPLIPPAAPLADDDDNLPLTPPAQQPTPQAAAAPADDDDLPLVPPAAHNNSALEPPAEAPFIKLTLSLPS